LASLYSVHQGSLILCTTCGGAKHLRCGQLPSAGPRQKEGAELARWDNWTGLHEG
jgi:hypothetical protein